MPYGPEDREEEDEGGNSLSDFEDAIDGEIDGDKDDTEDDTDTDDG